MEVSATVTLKGLPKTHGGMTGSTGARRRRERPALGLTTIDAEHGEYSTVRTTCSQLRPARQSVLTSVFKLQHSVLPHGPFPAYRSCIEQRTFLGAAYPSEAETSSLRPTPRAETSDE